MCEEYWYFTFGQNQEHAGHYVRIRGTFAEARAEMFARYGNKWAFQYSEKDWASWCQEAMKIGCRVETMPKLTACKHIFSNGTEFELFMERCFTCSRYRNDHCRILNACYEAMWNPDEFPFDDLMEWDNGYGGKSCRHYTEEPIGRSRNKKQTKGQRSFL